MKFAWKVFFITVLVVALSFSLGGSILILSSFNDSLNREINRSIEENMLLRFSFETAAMGAPLSSEGRLSDATIVDIARHMDTDSRAGTRGVRISDEGHRVLYENKNTPAPRMGLEDMERDQRFYRVQRVGAGHIVQTATMVAVGGRTLYLENVRNIAPIFAHRAEQFRVYRGLSMAILPLSALILFVMATLLTRPIRNLSATTRRIAGGAYSERAKAAGSDEIGEFTGNFNKMADALEERIHALEQVARQREEFVSNFAHELKTPLTAIIGYADMLRSKAMTPDLTFKSANYIFSEGKRLESLALKLLDLSVLRRESFDMRKVSAALLAEEIGGVLAPLLGEAGMSLNIDVQDAALTIEPDLVKTLLMNLIDNARKASERGAAIDLVGARQSGGYAFEVRDSGAGIPQEEIGKVTEAFYMIDKSRARAQSGAGIGLALCQEIARVHGTKLEINSVQGQGTTVRVLFGAASSLSWRRGARRR